LAEFRKPVSIFFRPAFPIEEIGAAGWGKVRFAKTKPTTMAMLSWRDEANVVRPMLLGSMGWGDQTKPKRIE
jgi:hypothetical protein